MKNTKLARAAALWLILVLSFTLCCSASAETVVSGDTCILDSTGLLSEDEFSALEARAEEISADYSVSVCILTVEDYTETGYYDAFDAAGYYYYGFDLGMGDSRDGVLLLLSMADRDYALYSRGDFGGYAFDDYGLLQLADVFLDDFAQDDWSSGFHDYLEGCAEYLALAESGHPVREPATGKIIAAIVISCLIALVVCLVMKGKMKSVHKGTEASAYVSDSLTLAESEDKYTHTTTMRRKVSSSSSSSGHSGHSGGHSSGSHGHSGKF